MKILRCKGTQSFSQLLYKQDPYLPYSNAKLLLLSKGWEKLEEELRKTGLEKSEDTKLIC